MKIKEIIEMSTDELLTKKRDLRQESLHLRLQQQSGQLEQPSRLRLLRREVARIETVLSKRTRETKYFLWQKNHQTRCHRRCRQAPDHLLPPRHNLSAVRVRRG